MPEACARPPRAVRSLSPVTMTMRKPQRVQRLQRRRRRLLDRIGDADEARDRAVDHHEHHRLALVAAGVGVACEAPRSSPSSASMRGVAERHRPAVDPARHALAGQRLELVRPGRSRGRAPRRRARSPRRADARSRAPGWRPAGEPPPRRWPRSGSTADRARACRRSACRSCRRSACRPMRSVSSASAFLISTPACAPRPVAVMIDIGVARPSAQGQAMISTAIAAISA